MHSKHWDRLECLTRRVKNKRLLARVTAVMEGRGNTIRTRGTRRRSRCGPFGCAGRSGTVLPTTILLDQMFSIHWPDLRSVKLYTLILIHTRVHKASQKIMCCSCGETCTRTRIFGLCNVTTSAQEAGRVCRLELEMKVHTKARNHFSWLKAATTAFTFKNLQSIKN